MVSPILMDQNLVKVTLKMKSRFHNLSKTSPPKPVENHRNPRATRRTQRYTSGFQAKLAASCSAFIYCMFLDRPVLIQKRKMWKSNQKALPTQHLICLLNRSRAISHQGDHSTRACRSCGTVTGSSTTNCLSQGRKTSFILNCKSNDSQLTSCRINSDQTNCQNKKERLKFKTHFTPSSTCTRE